MAALDLPPVTKSALIPQWVVNYANFIRSLANLTVVYGTSPGDPGGGVLQAGPGNTILRLNLAPCATQFNAWNGIISYAHVGGAAGTITVVNGLITNST